MKSVSTVDEQKVLKELQSTTPARVGVGRCGTRPPLDAWLKFRSDHAMARDAVHSELNEEFLRYAEASSYPLLRSTAGTKVEFIACPPKGKKADVSSLKETCPKNKDVQIVISDGLSASAIHANVRDVLSMLLDGLEQEGITCGVPIVVQYGRVAVADQIAYELGMKLAINLIGERPGLSAADSMSAYLTFNPGPHTISSDRTVVSNIHTRGTLPIEAGAYIVQLAKKILTLKVSGVRLQQIS